MNCLKYHDASEGLNHIQEDEWGRRDKIEDWYNLYFFLKTSTLAIAATAEIAKPNNSKEEERDEDWAEGEGVNEKSSSTIEMILSSRKIF